MESVRRNPYNLLSDIDSGTDNWHIKVRVSRKWKVFDFESQRDTMRVDMILIDEEGEQVHATIPKRHIMKFVGHLQEGDIFFISNFNVSVTNNNYRPVPNDHRIFIKWDTIVRHNFGDPTEFPKYRFYFVTFDDIPLRHNNNTLLTDVLGSLHSLSKVKKIPRKDGKEDNVLREMILEDNRGLKVKITLWGNAVDLIHNSIIELHSPRPVLVVTSSTVKKFNDEYYLSSTSATKVFVNLEIPEVAEFKPSVETSVKLLEALGSTPASLEKNPFNNRQTLSELFQIITDDSFEGKRYTCRAVICDVIHNYEPFYYACNECHRKVSSEGSSFWCKFCNKEGSNPTPRYRVRVHIKDATCSCGITIFDKEVERMLQRPVSEIVEIIASENGSVVVKDLMQKLIGLSYVFEIKINRHKYKDQLTHIFTATKLYDIIDHLEAQHFPDQLLLQQQAYEASHCAGSVDCVSQKESDVISTREPSREFGSQEKVAQNVATFERKECPPNKYEAGESSRGGRPPTPDKKDAMKIRLPVEDKAVNSKNARPTEDTTKVAQNVATFERKECPPNKYDAGESSRGGRPPTPDKKVARKRRLPGENKAVNSKNAVSTEDTTKMKKKLKASAPNDTATSHNFVAQTGKGSITPRTTKTGVAPMSSNADSAKSSHSGRSRRKLIYQEYDY